MTRQLRAYLLANIGFLVPSGLFTIIFPWLVVVALHESAERVGIAQMITQLPALVLLLVAGFIADRYDQRKILIVTHLLVALSQLSMAWLIGAGAMTFNSLLALALLGGIAGTFSGPPRDAMLTRVAGERIQHTVILVIGLQFGAQMIGFALASVTDRIGAPTLLVLSAVMFALGAIPCALLPGSEPRTAMTRHPLREIGVGLAMAMRSDRIRPALILTFALGLFFVGTFFVLLPLIIRDVYHGAAADLSLAFGLNMAGHHRGGRIPDASRRRTAPGPRLHAVVTVRQRDVVAALPEPAVLGVLPAVLRVGARRRTDDDDGAHYRAGSRAAGVERPSAVDLRIRNERRHADRIACNRLRGTGVGDVERGASAGRRHGGDGAVSAPDVGLLAIGPGTGCLAYRADRGDRQRRLSWPEVTCR